MRAAVWHGPGELSVEEVEPPRCPVDGALVRVIACGVSGGDVRLYYEGGDGVRPPWTFGHEISGELIEVGSQARAAGFDMELGQAVHVISTLTCGRCALCRQGMEHVCPNGLRMGRRLPGGFAQMVALPAMALRNVFPLPVGLDPAHSTFADPLSDVICAHKDLDIGVDQSVVVVGGGPVGVAHALLARAQGASVMLHERSPQRLALCRDVLGDDRIDYVDVSQGDAIELVRSATGGLGADRVIVATAAPRAQQDAVLMAAPRGRVLYFSDLPPGVEHIEFPLNFQYEREIAILGSYASRYRDQVRALDMLARDEGGITRLISDVVPLDRLVEAFARIRSGEVLKIVVRH